jgi:hypothetical protein
MRGVQRTVGALLAAISLAACGVHKPSEMTAQDTPSSAPTGDAPMLMGGPQRSGPTAGPQADGFILVGGPQTRPRRTARLYEVSNGFQTSAADPASVRPDPAPAAAAAPDPSPDDAPSPHAAASRLASRPAHQPAAAPASAPAAPAAGDLKALALVSSPAPSLAPAPGGEDVATDGGPPPFDWSRIGLFLVCLLAAGGLWSWHRRCQRASALARAVAGPA